MIIQSENVWIASQFIPAQIEIEEQKIKRVYPYGTHPVDVDYQDHKIVPGFIDIHIHGGYGIDTNDATFDEMVTLTQKLPSEGVTSFLPTTVTQTEEVLMRALKNVAEVKQQQNSGTQILGVHFEGPYLNIDFKGAQPGECIIKPDVKQFKRFYEASGELIRVITLAPEKDIDYELMDFCNTHNIVVSQGHSGANYEETLMGIANGVKSITHVFNGMSRFHHRDVNLTGAAFRAKDVFGEIIVDGVHSNFSNVHTFMTTKGKERAILITDALLGKGEPVGSEYQFGGHPVRVFEDGSLRLLDLDAIAGSTLLSNRGVQNIIEKVGLDWEYAVNASSLNPARLLGVDDHKGYIKATYDADLAILDKNFDVVATYILGKCEYSKQ